MLNIGFHQFLIIQFCRRIFYTLAFLSSNFYLSWVQLEPFIKVFVLLAFRPKFRWISVLLLSSMFSFRIYLADLDDLYSCPRITFMQVVCTHSICSLCPGVRLKCQTATPYLFHVCIHEGISTIPQSN